VENYYKSKSGDQRFTVRTPSTVSETINARLTGPGAIYNLGNILALSAGIALTLHEAWGQTNLLAAVYIHLMGSPEALALSISMLLFIISGEIYHRAYLSPDQRQLVAWADFVSGLAAVALTFSLMFLGESSWALLAGSTLIVGKMGTAVIPLLSSDDFPRLDRTLRLTVVASRVPSLVALALAVLPAVQGDIPPDAVVMPVIMIVCFLLWLWADFLLLRRG